ncbi:uncharacterized protein MONBRDRAFT_34403 [Monosiga brevicollis MX1]|uniref:carnitine O-palmitoyltransferase n=1 Tax=Monosiga brevicollis TaxID=81824 RepID=A9VBG4_MONBE|nr:uncharacterized protein MONBRDRAFT_34403 [Monosiga brevicollis MX1]EDQ85096.1 predicted protein [Monosiga brevicollis MX1]|eukprot:XP_001750100.1 hypothetical protein [Monosiga brevicollis MX1]
MAEARAMARSEPYNRPRRNSEYAAKTYTYSTRGGVWNSGDTAMEVMTNMARGLVTSAQSRANRIQRAIVNAVFPSTTATWYLSLGSAYLLQRYVPQFHQHMIQLPLVNRLTDRFAQLSAGVLVSGTGLWLAGIWGSRTLLKWLLSYKGYLYEPVSKTSTLTIIWLMTVRLLEGFGKPLTYSFQRVLPSLPVPALSETCRRYLLSARPLMDDVEYDRMVRLAHDFEHNEGPGLQFFLKLKALWASNYVSDWWERFVYLRSRDSLMINSNYYIMDAYSWSPTHVQAARAGNLVHNLMLFKRQLDRCEIEPLLIQGAVPLCMSQHVRTFGTCRIPQLEEDVIEHYPESAHIAVYCKGRFYVVNCFDVKGVRLSPRDLEKQFDYILEDADHDADKPTFAEHHLPAMTASDRTTWANFRSDHMGEGVTRASLEAIERAVIFVVLDDSSPENPDMKDWAEGHPLAKSLLHGNGYNRWFDKSITLVIFANGRCGVNCEHSWADAPVAAYAFESMLAMEFSGTGYDDNGLNKAVPQARTEPKLPLRLKFAFDEQAESIVREAVDTATKAINDLDHRLLPFTDYSKGLMKRCKLSPDGWLQMALQLAYFRDQGRFAQTYEASMTRLFRDGRTETVRPVTDDSVAFVRAMEDPKSSKEECIALLRSAVDRHVIAFKDAMAGRGIDRHLFCLYVVSIARGIESKFLNEVLSKPWMLSTSQTPVQQTKLFDIKNNLNKISTGGGFGPVTDDGYGVSYIIGSDSLVSFHVTSKNSSDKTSSHRFAKNIEKAMADIKALFCSIMAHLPDLANEHILPLLQLNDELFRLTQHEDKINVTSIVAVGDQSSGKTSIIEALSGVNLPRGEGIVTRVPLMLKLRNAGDEAERVLLKPLNRDESISEKVISDLDRVSESVANMTDDLVGSDKDVEDKPLELTIFRKNQVDLTLIDLPGMTRVAVEGQSENIEETIKAMYKKYMDPKEAVLLNVVNATSDVTASASLQLSRTVDKDKERTLVCLTKIDLCPPKALRKALEGARKLCGPGTAFLVRNRTQEESEADMSNDEARQLEQDCLKDIFPDNAHRQGIAGLTQQLVQLQAERIHATLPKVKTAIEEALLDVRTRLRELPRKPTSEFEALREISNRLEGFVKKIKDEVQGRTSDDHALLQRGVLEDFLEGSHEVELDSARHQDIDLGDDMKLRVMLLPPTHNQDVRLSCRMASESTSSPWPEDLVVMGHVTYRTAAQTVTLPFERNNDGEIQLPGTRGITVHSVQLVLCQKSVKSTDADALLCAQLDQLAHSSPSSLERKLAGLYHESTFFSASFHAELVKRCSHLRGGDGLPGTVPANVTTEQLKRLRKDLPTLALDFVNQVAEAVSRKSHVLLAEAFQGIQAKQVVCAAAQTYLEAQAKSARHQVTRVIEWEKSVTTTNHYFMSIVSDLLSDLERGRLLVMLPGKSEPLTWADVRKESNETQELLQVQIRLCAYWKVMLKRLTDSIILATRYELVIKPFLLDEDNISSAIANVLQAEEQPFRMGMPMQGELDQIDELSERERSLVEAKTRIEEARVPSLL